VYSQRNRSAACRIPLYSQSPKAKRSSSGARRLVEPVPGVPRHAVGGLDGVQNQIEPPAPLEVDLFDLPAEELANIPHTPGSLEEAMDALEADNDFCGRRVFTDDLLETWIDYKRLEEADAVRLRPTPTSSASTTTFSPPFGRPSGVRTGAGARAVLGGPRHSPGHTRSPRRCRPGRARRPRVGLGDRIGPRGVDMSTRRPARGAVGSSDVARALGRRATQHRCR